ncbi:hypothetical protein [Streptomyces buecherae]|uniref:hypothetical protein n=1 Tax=Streptomyces buecherae TaxID=2763006 RepID=UPI00378BB24B
MAQTPSEYTPHGEIPASHVIHLSRGETVKVIDGHLQKLDLATDSVVEDLGPVSPEDAAATDPFTHAQVLRQQHGFVSAVEFDGYTPTAPLEHIQSLHTTWVVPEYPADRSIFICVWNGLSGGALQPVVYYWSATQKYYLWPWAFIAGRYVNGPSKVADPGLEVTGYVEYLGRDGDGYRYKEGFVGYPELDFTVTRTAEQGPADGVIVCTEDRGVPVEKWPPNPKVAMKDIKVTMQSGYIAPESLSWVAGGERRPTPSGKNTVIVNSSSQKGVVDFYFH